MTPQELNIFIDCCKRVRKDPHELQDENPFTKKGGVAQMIQMAASQFHPEQAARWRNQAGLGISTGTKAELRSGAPLSQKAMADLWEHDLQFVVESRRHQQQQDEQALAALEEQATEKRLRNRAVQFGGDLAQAQRSIDAEDQQQAQREQQRQLQAQQGRELEQRLEQQRINHARMAGVQL